MSDETKHQSQSELQDDLGELSPEEVAEAEELARLLAGRSHVSLSEEALQGAGLMRLGKLSELSPASRDRIELELLAGMRGRGPSEVQTRKVWWWLLAALAPATALVVFLVNTSQSGSSTGSFTAFALPEPDVAVLQAQASWVASDKQRSTFEREMQDYRKQVLASLDSN